MAVPAGQRIRYREEISHPALDEPEVASGTMYVAADGTLVRDQEVPERQISEVGDTMLATRAAPEAEATLYPILGEVRPMLLALRRMLAGDGGERQIFSPIDLGSFIRAMNSFRLDRFVHAVRLIGSLGFVLVTLPRSDVAAGPPA